MPQPTYYTSALASAAAANKNHLIVFNASGSNLTLRLVRLIATGAPTAAVTGLVIPLIVKRITAAPTLGTALTFGKAPNSALALPSQVTANTGGTLATGVAAEAFGAGTVTGEETAAASNAVLYESQIDGSEAMAFGVNEGFVVQQGALASAGAINVVALFRAA